MAAEFVPHVAQARIQGFRNLGSGDRRLLRTARPAGKKVKLNVAPVIFAPDTQGVIFAPEVVVADANFPRVGVHIDG